MIIELTDRCILIFDNTQYKLIKTNENKELDDNGNPKGRTIGYYKTVGDAVDNVIKITIEDRYSDKVLTLKEYIAIYKDVRNEIASRT